MRSEYILQKNPEYLPYYFKLEIVFYTSIYCSYWKF